MFVIISVLVLALDQYTKYLVSCNMVYNQSITVIPGIFDLTYVRNTGAAFGIFEGRQTLLTAVTIIMILLLSIYAVSQRKKIPAMERIALAFIVSGGLGNCITRMLYRYVIDFFNFHFWPVFNVADIFICIGCGLLILSVIILEPIKEKKKNAE